MAGCEKYAPKPSPGITFLGYNLTLQLAYDPEGCAKNDPYALGIRMADYGINKCASKFDNIIDQCK